MAVRKFTVTGDQDRAIDARMCEIKRQIRQEGGQESPLNPKLVLQALQRVIEGDFGACTIDCEAPIPDHLMDGFTRHEKDQVVSRVRGKVSVDPVNPFNTHLVTGQKHGAVPGKKVLTELKREGVPVYGIAALEQMLQKGLIPDELKGPAIFAWGDVLRDGHGDLCVRDLYWRGGEWHRGCSWLVCDWFSNHLAAVRAS